MANDTISRKATIDAMEDVDWYHINKDGQLTHGANSEEDEPLYKAEDVYKVLNDMPTAQPEQRWIPVKAHPATDEERESRPDINYWLDCEMPDDGQEILVTVKHKDWIGVEKDVCYVDSDYSLDSGYDWLDDIIAWMPLPEPYREGE